MLPAQAPNPLRGPLALCSTGEDVRTLQRLLNNANLGILLTADGIFGIRTDKALRDFQRHKGLKPDGIAGPLTAQALGIGYTGSHVTKVSRYRPGTLPRPETQPPLDAIANAIIQGLDPAYRNLIKQDILSAGASAEQTKNALEAIDSDCFAFLSRGLKDWADAKNLDAEFIWLDLTETLLQFQIYLGTVGKYVKEKGHGKTTQLAERIESLDVPAIQRVVRFMLKGVKSEGLEGALWDIHLILGRAVRP